MGRERDTNLKPWIPGETISVRLRNDDDDIAKYLNEADKPASEELISALRFKMEVQKMNDGQVDIQPDHVPLLNEIERIVEIHLSNFEQRVLNTLSQLASNGLILRDNELSASNDELNNDVKEDTEDDVSAAMGQFGIF